MKRSAGVLLNISSLPGQYGIGGFSCNAERFADFIASLGFKVWQTLPITTAGAGNSPYSGVSAFAGNYLYIDLERLPEGLLTADELNSSKYYGQYFLTEYEYAREMKARMLNLAFTRIDGALKKKIDAFALENADWLTAYASFMALKKRFENKPWLEWSKEYKVYSASLAKKIEGEDSAAVGFYRFEQYVFFTQWAAIKSYANKCGLSIFGDIPIYVSLDSADVWSDPKQFLLDEKFNPKKVAGVPPDYFCADGQLWGNPVYDYKFMQTDGFKWWIRRIKHCAKMYDILRIDHFRGFYNYWAVPPKAETAKSGKWEIGPRKALFDALKPHIGEIKLVAEDLGSIDKGVEEFLSSLGIAGMHVMQFGFDGDPNNKHLPHTYEKNCVAYTGTHDNDTTLGWLLSLDSETRAQAFNYVNCTSETGWASGGGQCPATRAFIRTLLSSTADLAVIPLQDLCGYGSDTRMNVPGVADGCWRYRTNYSALDNIDQTFVRDMIKLFGRL